MFTDDSDNKFFGFPFLTNNLLDREQNNGTKTPHDTYRVYVNKEYVGNKVLIAQSEKIEDVEKYLKNKGFDNFSTSLEGNDYAITSEGTEAADMKSTLDVYLHIR